MSYQIRRVVTGQDASGRSRVIFDSNDNNQKESLPGVVLTDLWETLASPANNEGIEDAAARPVRLTAPSPGTIFRTVEFPPDSTWRDVKDPDSWFDSVGAASARDSESDDPMRHKTDTIDYIIVMKGEIYAVLDDEEVLLKAGDTFIQRGTVHSWSVRGSEPCLVGVVLVAADPV